jgi:hypothetical protein
LAAAAWLMAISFRREARRQPSTKPGDDKPGCAPSPPAARRT